MMMVIININFRNVVISLFSQDHWRDWIENDPSIPLSGLLHDVRCQDRKKIGNTQSKKNRVLGRLYKRFLNKKHFKQGAKITAKRDKVFATFIYNQEP